MAWMMKRGRGKRSARQAVSLVDCLARCRFHDCRLHIGMVDVILVDTGVACFL